MRLYSDSAKCSGCRSCLVACSLHLFQGSNPKKAALRLIPHFPSPGVYELKVCTQCGDCAAVCPNDAIVRNERGAYTVNPELCDLCEACVTECPEDVMFVRHALSGTAWKCDGCGDCVSVCGMDALWIGAKELAAA